MSGNQPSPYKDQFARHLGMEIVFAQEGSAKVRLAIQPQLLNGKGIVHGGVLFSLADYAFAVAANTPEESALAVNSTIHFTKAAQPEEELFAEAKLISRSRRLGTYQVRVMDASGNVLASMQCMAYFKLMN